MSLLIALVVALLIYFILAAFGLPWIVCLGVAVLAFLAWAGPGL